MARDAPMNPGDDAPPSVVGGRYEIIRLIGEGGMAKVYEVRHTLINRSFALKVLNPKIADDADVVARFLNEGRLAGTLGHPHIVESIDMGYTESGTPFIVYELLKGQSLADYIDNNRKLSPFRAAHILAQIASALETAHAAKIVHRDLKPENIILLEKDGDDFAKVIDFGISKSLVAVGDRQRTQLGRIIGTPAYMSPEQIDDNASVDERSDVYSLGCVAYEMIAGQAPFCGLQVSELLYRIVTLGPRPINEISPGLPRMIVRIVEKCMARNRADRFQTMTEVREAFNDFLGADTSGGQAPMAGPLEFEPPRSSPSFNPPRSSPSFEATRRSSSFKATRAPPSLEATRRSPSFNPPGPPSFEARIPSPGDSSRKPFSSAPPAEVPRSPMSDPSLMPLPGVPPVGGSRHPIIPREEPDDRNMPRSSSRKMSGGGPDTPAQPKLTTSPLTAEAQRHARRNAETIDSGEPRNTPAPISSRSHPIPGTASLTVTSTTPGALIHFRNIEAALPFTFRRAEPKGVEAIEVMAPGRQGLRFRLVLASGTTLRVALPPGDGLRDATQEETRAALGKQKHRH